jgi:hypothetical protein
VNRRYLLVVLALLAALAIGVFVAGHRPPNPTPFGIGTKRAVVSDQDWHIVVQGSTARIDARSRRRRTTSGHAGRRTAPDWPRTGAG